MNTMGRTGLVLGLAVVALLVVPVPAAAYVGPGAGLAIIGAAIAVIGAILATVGGFVWYPVKRLWRAIGRRTRDSPADEG
jgi:uncharacterized membrane protein